MRGKVLLPRRAGLVIGITPAYAGKSHPLLPPPFHDVGSPPPMRGKGISNVCNHKPRGITPAYAGKSPPKTRCRRSSKDHPRLCGEKRQITRVLFLPAGSPPPMRGKVHVPLKDQLDHRITPAYAGKSRCTD